MTYQLVHLQGVPYFLKDSRLYTFELNDGQPSSHSVAIGTYENESVVFDDGWMDRVQGRLQAFRDSIEVVERDKHRERLDKPQKQRNAAAHKPKHTRAKSGKSNEAGH